MRGMFFSFAACALAQACGAQDTPASTADQRYEDLRTAVNIGELTVSGAIGDDRVNKAMYAMGWLDGVYSVLALNGAARYPMAACLPSGLSRLSMARIYLHYMDANPDSHGMQDTAVATLSAIKAFPCSEKKGG